MAKTHEQILAEVKQTSEWAAAPELVKVQFSEIVSGPECFPEEIKCAFDRIVAQKFLRRLGLPDGSLFHVFLSDELQALVYAYLALAFGSEGKN